MKRIKTLIIALLLSLSMSAPALADTGDYDYNILESLNNIWDVIALEISLDLAETYVSVYRMQYILTHTDYAETEADAVRQTPLIMGLSSRMEFTLPKMYYYTYYYSDENIQSVQVIDYCTIPYWLSMKTYGFNQYLLASAKQFFNWFYPLKASEPVYWQVWNSETEEVENVNLATVGYYITWYLGQMYQMNTYDVETNGLTAKAKEFDATAKDFDESVSDSFQSVQSSISGFAPDASKLRSFGSAFSWVSQYLQKCFVALDDLAIPITVSLVLAICMQFVGFYKFKRG